MRNVWRLYGGWYDGNPARLKPPPAAALAAEVAALAGGAGRLADRALALADAGDRGSPGRSPGWPRRPRRTTPWCTRRGRVRRPSRAATSLSLPHE